VFGEQLAARFLAGRGAQLLSHNLRVGRGEVDLVIAIGNQKVVVEVKTIQTGGLDDPTYAFTPTKARRVRRWATAMGIRRIDLVAVTVGEEGVGIRWVPQVV
jgi:putative endonuclease